MSSIASNLSSHHGENAGKRGGSQNGASGEGGVPLGNPLGYMGHLNERLAATVAAVFNASGGNGGGHQGINHVHHLKPGYGGHLSRPSVSPPPSNGFLRESGSGGASSSSPLTNSPITSRSPSTTMSPSTMVSVSGSSTSDKLLEEMTAAASGLRPPLSGISAAAAAAAAAAMSGHPMFLWSQHAAAAAAAQHQHTQLQGQGQQQPNHLHNSQLTSTMTNHPPLTFPGLEGGGLPIDPSCLCFCPVHRGFHHSWTVYGLGPDGAIQFNPPRPLMTTSLSGSTDLLKKGGHRNSSKGVF